MAVDVRLCAFLIYLFLVKTDASAEWSGDLGSHQGQGQKVNDLNNDLHASPVTERPSWMQSLPAVGHNCDGKDAASHNFTVVTALYDLGRENWPHFRRRLSTYLTYAVRLLALDVPLVAYIDETVEPFVRHFRGHLDRITVYKISDLSELPYYEKYRERMAWVMNTEDFHRNNGLLGHPEGFSPEYNVLMNAKFTMLRDTVHENPFNSSYFYWLDMGYGHGQDVYPKHCDWTPRNIMDDLDKITYVAVNNVSTVRSIFQLYKQRVGPGVNGGFFGGSAKAVEDYYELHHFVLEDFLAHNMVDDDQTIAVECFLRKPSLFNMVPGEWYDVFKLFH